MSADDQALDLLFQSAIAGITGIDPTLVRPRWQTVVPKQPPPGTDWVALGVIEEIPNAGPYLEESAVSLSDPADTGSMTSQRHDEITLLASFYGPHGQANAKRLRDGLGIPQNTEPLNAQDIVYVNCGTLRPLPELVNQQWVRRYDLPLRFRMKDEQVYLVRRIGFVNIHLFDDTVVDATIQVPRSTPSP